MKKTKNKVYSFLSFVLLFITIFSPFGVSKTQAADIKTLTITFSGVPSYVNVTKAPLKYNKKFAFSMNADDGFKDSYTIFYRALNGGRIANSDTFSRGYYYTDGAGNKIPFRGNFQLNTMKINSDGTFSNTKNIGNTAYVDWNEATIVSNKGWDNTNHGWSHNGYPDPVDKIFYYPEPHGPSTIDYDFEIEQNQDDIEANTGRRPIIMGQPDADSGYTPYIFTNHGLFARVMKISPINRYTVAGTNVANNLNLDQYEILGYVFSNYEDTASDLMNFMDFIDNSSTGGNHYWNRVTFHRFYETEGNNGFGYPSLKQFLDYTENNYGINGDDSIWFASSQEVYEYLYSKQSLNITQNLVGNTLTLTLDFGNYPTELRRQGISLLVDSDSTISNVTSPDNNNYITFNPSTGLINADWKFVNNDAFEKDCEDKVSTAETSRSQTDFDEASDYVNAMADGATKTSLLNRLNDIEIFAREWFVSFGTSTTSSRGKIWNGVNAVNVTNKTLNEATGVASSLKYDTVNAFGGIGSNGVTPNPSDSGKYADNITKAYAYPLASPATPIVFKISNLNPDKLYDIELFASKTTAGTSTYYVIGDTTSNTQTLNLYNNTQNTVTFYKIKPSATNDIQVNVAVGGRIGVFHLTERPNIQEPVASIGSGLYGSTQNVSLSSSNSDFIRYSFDSIPATCSDGNLYSGPIAISSSTNLYVKACDNSGNFSTSTFTYTIDTTPPSTPSASVPSGSYNGSQTVSLSASGSDYIKYSKVEMPISCFYGNLYTDPVIIDSSETLYVIACDNADNFSSTSFTYIIDSNSPEVPIASPSSGTYNSTQSVSLSSEGSDYIKYSTESMPDTCSDGTLYTDPISVSSSQTLYVRACDNAENYITDSFSYIINKSKPIRHIVSSGSSASVVSEFINSQNKPTPDKITNEPKEKDTKITRTLKFNMTGEDVRLLQIYLNEHGYTVSNSGAGSKGHETNLFGLKTKQAVIRFQLANKLIGDGIVGPLTREFLK